jgi:hypothetical protein
MVSDTNSGSGPIYAYIKYEDPYVQPLILSALEKRLPPSSYKLITSQDQLPSPSSKFLQWLQYEEIDFQHHLSHSATSQCNAYIIRKALIRKHYLSTTVSNWVTKHPDSVLKEHVKPSVAFEVDYAEFLDDALVEAYELRESWQRGEGKDAKDREWWILKPGMSERGQGIRLFSSEEELTEIFEVWDPEDSDEEDEEDDAAARSDQGDESDKGNGIITSQLRHFIAQPYIHPPLLLSPPGTSASETAPRKFHIRTYVLTVGALKVYVYRDMLALFAARPYTPPWETTSSNNDEEALKAHLTNTCLQETNEREGSVSLFWQDLPSLLPGTTITTTNNTDSSWKEAIFNQILAITRDTFQAAANTMSIHFQTLPNSFELFGLDFMVGIEEGGVLRTYLLEVNAFPDFRQTGDECRGVVEGLFEGVVDVGIRPFFGVPGEEGKGDVGRGEENMVKVLDVDLGRR